MKLGKPLGVVKKAASKVAGAKFPWMDAIFVVDMVKNKKKEKQQAQREREQQWKDDQLINAPRQFADLINKV